MNIKDMTPKQAERWVAQELAKVTVDNAASRLRSERAMVQFGSGGVPSLPNSLKAHQGLIEAIKQKFSID